MRPSPALLLLAIPLATAPVSAADRTVSIGSFERLRVEGPFEATVTTGSPSVRIAGDLDAIQAIDVRLDGTTLTIRRRLDLGGDVQRRSTAPIRLTLSTPSLASAQSVAGARLTIARLRGPKIDLVVSGSGAIAVTAVDGAEISAMLAGAGRIALAGRVGKARLTKNGEGTLDASALDAGELLVAADGIGDLSARARYTAQVSNAGTGQVTIAGTSRCVIRPANGGPVTCGKQR
jgi:hypothetical protein